MRLEDMKQDFPKMPEEMRKMIEQEVKKQVKTTVRRKTHKGKTALIAALVAAMALGTTVFAGFLYRMHSEPVGKYAVRTTIMENGENSPETGQDIPKVRMEVSYLPAGMVQAEEGKYCYPEAMYQGGVSLIFYGMDTGDAQFELLTTDVAASEEIQVGEFDGVYLELHSLIEEGLSFNKRIYVAYPNVHYVMGLYAASDVSKEEALKIAEGIRLIPVSDEETENIVQAYRWSDYLAAQNGKEEAGVETGSVSVAKETMKNTHSIGEAFVDAEKGVEIKVSKVEVFDDISPLDLSAMNAGFKQELAKETDAAGKLLPAKINYIKYGDGINTINEIVDSREVGQKLVYVTVEYTNISDKALPEVLFWGNLMKFVEDGNSVKMYDRGASGSSWDAAEAVGAAHWEEMWYYDVHGGERKNNYITNLKPGETASVHMAWLVPEDELEYLYLNLDTTGSAYFSEDALETGYVDIRQ